MDIAPSEVDKSLLTDPYEMTVVCMFDLRLRKPNGNDRERMYIFVSFDMSTKGMDKRSWKDPLSRSINSVRSFFSCRV